MKAALTFDCYGTLLDTGPLYDCVGDIARKGGISPEQSRTVFTHYEDRLMYGEEFIPYDALLAQALEYCDLELNTDLFAQAHGQILEAHQAMRPFPDVLPALRQLKELDFGLFLMSNSVHSLMAYHLEALEQLFDGVLLAEDAKCYKPDLDFFHQAERTLPLADAEHLHIAAGYWWDIVPCSKLGWNKVWLNRKGQRGSPRHQPYQELTSLSQLIPLLS